jgi:hypothetical protein
MAAMGGVYVRPSHIRIRLSMVFILDLKLLFYILSIVFVEV